MVGRATDSDNLDPVTCVGNANIFVFNLIVEGLVKTSDDGSEILPCLATDWEVSEDGTTYTFNVQEGLLFADGSPVTAADWQCTFDRAIEAEDSNWHMCVENIDHVECPDDTTVIVVTKEPAALHHGQPVHLHAGRAVQGLLRQGGGAGATRTAPWVPAPTWSRSGSAASS